MTVMVRKRSLATSAAARRAATGAGGLAAAVLLGAGHDGELEYGALAAAGRAGDSLGPVADNLLKGVAAIFANVFVDRHKKLPGNRSISVSS